MQANAKSKQPERESDRKEQQPERASDREGQAAAKTEKETLVKQATANASDRKDKRRTKCVLELPARPESPASDAIVCKNGRLDLGKQDSPDRPVRDYICDWNYVVHCTYAPC